MLPEKPWLTEPDFAQWLDPSTGLRCAVVRVPALGTLCGYVCVPRGAFKTRLRTPAIRPGLARLLGRAGARRNVKRRPVYAHPALHRVRVHGGLTYSGQGPHPFMRRSKSTLWLGFDCGHAGDYAPKLVETLTKYGMPGVSWDGDVYRTFDYVRAQCQALAAQIYQLAQEHQK